MIPEQGVALMKRYKKPEPINLDWLHKDSEGDVEVFFAVYNPPPLLQGHTPRDLHWSIAWQIRDTGAWRQVHVVEEKIEVAREQRPLQLYVYWGPLTKSSGPTDGVAKRYSLGVFPLAQRLQIEELARQVPVMVPDGTWNCQDWILDLLSRMVSEGILPKDSPDSAVISAGRTSGKLSLVVGP